MLHYRTCLSSGEQACTLGGAGFLGVFIGFLCPLCVPATAAFFSAIGLTFIPQAKVIYPLIGVFSLIFLYGLVKGVKKHGDLSPILFGVLGILTIPYGRYVLMSAMLTYTGSFCVLLASVWNMMLPAKTQESTPLDTATLRTMIEGATV